MTHASLFSGIGGFDLAAEWMGWSNVFNCEWEEFPRQVLRHHFPNAKQYGDIRELDATEHHGRVDVLTGGFPCQPYSVAGKRLGKEDERHLWPEMLRVIRECSPTWVVGENVRGLVNWNDGLVFQEVCLDLEAQGYEVQPLILPAAGVASCPHRRDRVWFVAYSDYNRKSGRPKGDEAKSQRKGIQERDGVQQLTESSGIRQLPPDTRSLRPPSSVADRKLEGRQRPAERRERNVWDSFPTQPALCGGNDGLPKELDNISFPKWRKESIKAYGNAIVPSVAYQIFRAIEQYALHPQT